MFALESFTPSNVPTPSVWGGEGQKGDTLHVTLRQPHSAYGLSIAARGRGGFRFRKRTRACKYFFHSLRVTWFTVDRPSCFRLRPGRVPSISNRNGQETAAKVPISLVTGTAGGTYRPPDRASRVAACRIRRHGHGRDHETTLLNVFFYDFTTRRRRRRSRVRVCSSVWPGGLLLSRRLLSRLPRVVDTAQTLRHGLSCPCLIIIIIYSCTQCCHYITVLHLLYIMTLQQNGHCCHCFSLISKDN